MDTAEGYAKISQFMGVQEENAIFRRFRSLNAQNLLHLQAELTHLERDLENLRRRDAADENGEYFNKDWWWISHGTCEKDKEQWNKMLDIRGKLEQYNQTLLTQAKVARLGPPSEYDLGLLREWWKRKDMGNYPLLGPDCDSYSKDYDNDLVAVKTRSSPDAFSRWFAQDFMPRWNGRITSKIKDLSQDPSCSGYYIYTDSFLETAARAFVAVVASLLPMCSIVALYFVQGGGAKLGVVVAASAIFSCALALMTNARMIEIFAATAAYAAVNVVFLTGTIAGL